jgi:hypothetical protein
MIFVKWTSPSIVDTQMPLLSKARQKQRIKDSEPDSEVVGSEMTAAIFTLQTITPA